MDKVTATRAALAVVIFVMGNLQAWDSGVPEAGLLIVFLVSLAIALPAVALLVPVIIARLISPISLPGLFIVLVPAVMALIFTGIFRRYAKT